MAATQKNKNTTVANVLRRMRESSKLTIRQAGGIIGVTHAAINLFENQRLDLPDYRIEQLVKAYGYTMDDFNKIMGRAPVINLQDDCHAILDRLNNEQLSALRAVMLQMLHASNIENATQSTKTPTLLQSSI